MTDIFKTLPDSLKDPKKYTEIEEAVMEIMKSECSHKKVATALKCKKCNIEDKMQKRREYLKEQGFKDYHQYLRWKQVIEIMNKAYAQKETNKETKQKA